MPKKHWDLSRYQELLKEKLRINLGIAIIRFWALSISFINLLPCAANCTYFALALSRRNAAILRIFISIACLKAKDLKLAVRGWTEAVSQATVFCSSVVPSLSLSRCGCNMESCVSFSVDSMTTFAGELAFFVSKATIFFLWLLVCRDAQAYKLSLVFFFSNYLHSP